MQDFRRISPQELRGNVFSMLASDWALVAAADGSKANAMTVSWGGLGVLWGKPVATIYIRPTRYTYGLLEQEAGFSLNFFDESYREALSYCGKVSGRDEDKLAHCGLTAPRENGVPYLAQAQLSLVCKKIYTADFDPDRFLDPEVDAKHYPLKDYHRIYIGEIETVLAR